MTTIDENGFTLTPYETRLANIQAGFQGIYGDDASVDPATPDGQLLALIAEAQSSCDQVAAECYASFDAATTTGAPLTRMGALSGVQRKSGAYSYVTVTCTGTPNAPILNPIIANSSGTQFAYSGTITLNGVGTASAVFASTEKGAFDVTAQTATRINPQWGWTGASITSGTQGSAYEDDPAFRLRRSQSVARASVALDDSMYAAIMAIDGITDCVILDNRGQATDANGLPAHSICVVVDGADAGSPPGQLTAEAVWSKLAPGPTLYAPTILYRPDGGDATDPYYVTDSRGTVRSIYVNECSTYTPQIKVTGSARVGWNGTTGPAAIASALAAWGPSALKIGTVLVTDDCIPTILDAVRKNNVLSTIAVSKVEWSLTGSPGDWWTTPLVPDAFRRIKIAAANVSVVIT